MVQLTVDKTANTVKIRNPNNNEALVAPLSQLYRFMNLVINTNEQS
jgi:hypothetical protein